MAQKNDNARRESWRFGFKREAHDESFQPDHTRVLDPTRVNVQYTPTGSSQPTLVPQTTDGSAMTCGPDGGWHYDNPTAPTAIKLCPTTCTSLGSGRVEVQFGCQTVVQPPR